MEQYNVTGMSCAACQARVEKAVSQVPGVSSCAVSLLTNSMGVEGTASSADIIKAVEKAGYGASLKGNEKKSAGAQEDLPSGSQAQMYRTEGYTGQRRVRAIDRGPFDRGRGHKGSDFKHRAQKW